MSDVEIPLHILKLLVKESGTQQSFATEIGTTQPTVSRWLTGKQQPEQPFYSRIIALLEKRGGNNNAEEITVPLVGFAGADSELSYYEVAGTQGELGRVGAPPGSNANTVAVEIKGISLGPVFDGWLAFYDEVRRPMDDDLLNRLCVLGLPSGKVVIKKVARGQLPNAYNLIAQLGPPMYDQEIAWAAEVQDMRPR